MLMRECRKMRKRKIEVRSGQLFSKGLEALGYAARPLED
jgi:hypothetical protein